MPDQLVRTFWFDRFRVFAQPGGYMFRDALLRGGRFVAADYFSGLTGRELDVALFQHGFMSPCLPPFPKFVADRSRHSEDLLFWQFPCRTEGIAHDQHASLTSAPLHDGALHCFVGLPWATFIDKERCDEAQLQVARVRLSGLRHALKALGVGLRVHTVCQHIYWRRMAKVWSELRITDAWVSHAPESGVVSERLPFSVHPWALYAVNVEDAERRSGLVIGKPPAEKPLLASFIGAHMSHYLSDVRLRLQGLMAEPGFLIRVNQDKWHFEDVVYGHQVRNEPLASVYQIDDSVAEYNRVLSDSVFALCPSGAGPNTLRLWEALAVGSVPVLLGPAPALPQGGSLPPIDWDRIVLRFANEQIPDLPRLLKTIPPAEIANRQRRGMEAYQMVREQRCF